MAHSDDIGSRLQRETLEDMADTFFGARKRIDEEKELFLIRAGRVREKGAQALSQAAPLHALLLDGDAAREFYAALDVDDCRFIDFVEPKKARMLGEPLRWPKRWRYCKLVREAYGMAQALFDEYLNGRFYSDPKHHGRIVQSMHYARLQTWCGEINADIERVNAVHAPSSVLLFAKGLDIERVERERITGGGNDDFATTLDSALRIAKLDFAALELLRLPELPHPDKAEKRITAFAKNLYDANSGRIEGIVERLTHIDD